MCRAIDEFLMRKVSNKVKRIARKFKKFSTEENLMWKETKKCFVVKGKNIKVGQEECANYGGTSSRLPTKFNQ